MRDGASAKLDRHLPWLRWAGEFVLIVVSVFLGVSLERVSQERADRAAARVALAQLLGELREDLRDIDRIAAKQDSLDGDYTNLARWLAAWPSHPTDSVGDALYRVSAENWTLFPRRSSWTTMVAGNQLADLEDAGLVLRLGQLYETVYDRIDYNSRFYDENLNRALQSSPAVRWQSLSSAPLSTRRAEIEQLSAALEWVHVMWNVWYRDLLIGFRSDVVSTIESVVEYLQAHGVPASALGPLPAHDRARR